MRRYHWTEVSGEKECLQCAVLGETTILEKRLTLLQGNDAAVKFDCPCCGFKAVGVVAVDGSEPEELFPGLPHGKIRVIPGKKPVYNSPALADPMEGFPVEENYVPPKTDQEAVQRAFGEIVEPEEFLAIIENGYDEGVSSGDWKAMRRITPTRLRMGEVETIDVLVEFLHGQEVVYSCSHTNTAGVPDFEGIKNNLRESCRFAIVGPRRGPAVPAPATPRGPVEVVSQGWGATATVANGEVDDANASTRARLMASFRG